MRIDKIDKKLNLIIPVERDGKPQLYVHSAPIGSEVFDAYFAVLARTFTDMYALGHMAGPRVADKVLRATAEKMGVWEDSYRDSQRIMGAKNGLVAEIHRLTNVASPSERGWEQLPYYEARTRGVLDSEEVAEVDSAIVFFTLVSVMHTKAERAQLFDLIRESGARIESSNCTDFMKSLLISTAGANTGETATAS